MRASARRLPGHTAGSGEAERGFGLVEALIAMALLSVAALGIGQMVVTGVYVSEAAEDLTNVTALASQRMESLKATHYTNLVAGGDLANDVAGYSDTLDMDGDGIGEVVRRWQVTDLGDAKQIDVLVLGPPTAAGQARRIRLTAQVVDE